MLRNIASFPSPSMFTFHKGHYPRRHVCLDMTSQSRDRKWAEPVYPHYIFLPMSQKDVWAVGPVCRGAGNLALPGLYSRAVLTAASRYRPTVWSIPTHVDGWWC